MLDLFGTTLQRRYLTGKYFNDEVNEEEAQFEVMGIEVNTHTHGIDKQHSVDAIKKHVGLSYDKTQQILKTLFSRLWKANL